jgi:hypothetical protein
MRVGVITFHCSYNFGSVLQAWALTQQLCHMGQLVVNSGYDVEDTAHCLATIYKHGRVS